MKERPTIKVFISYAHKDKIYVDVFCECLKRYTSISETYNWDIWNDRNIHVGSIWDDEIQMNLNDADIAILLVSDSFLVSDYIENKEFKTLIDRFYKEEVIVFPVLFAPCDYYKWEELASRQFFKPEGKNYGKDHIYDFTFTDLIKFRETDGKLIPNNNISRYIKDLVQSLEGSIGRQNEKKYKVTNMKSEAWPTKINSVPYYNINNLVDRKNLLYDINRSFDESTEIILINGIAGIGKTAIALSYANHPVFSKSYQHLAWVTVISTIKKDLMQNISTDDIKFKYNPELGEDMNFANFIKFMQNFKGNSLLIIDSADNHDEIIQIKEELHKLNWKILITSRSNPKYMKVFRVNELDSDYAKELFYRYFEKSTENSVLEKILKQIENHTLLIELLAKAGNENPFITNCDEIYELLCKQGIIAEDFKVNIPIGKKESNLYNYITAIFNTKNLTCQEQDYLRYFSIMPSTEVDIKDLMDLFQVDQNTRIDFANTLNKLAKKGWLINNGRTYKCHQLIQTALRENMKPDVDNCLQLIESLIKKLDWKYEDDETYVEKSRFIPFAETIWNLLDRENPYVSELGCEIARLYCSISNVRVAVDIIKQVVEIRKKIYPPNHPQLAESLNRYSYILWKWGDYSNAIEHSKLAIDIIEQHPVEEYFKEYIKFYKTIALSERRNGLYDDAMKHFELSIELLKKYLDRDLKNNEVRLSRCYNDLAWVYRSLGKYEDAHFYFKKSMEIAERNLPVLHPSLALCYVNYSWILVKFRNYESARHYLDKALDIRKTHFGDENLSFCPIYRNYAELYKETGELHQAKKYIQMAIDLGIKGLYEDHLTISHYYKLLAEIEEKFGNYSDCCKYIKMAVEIYESKFPGGHPTLEKYQVYYEEIKSKFYIG